MKIVLTGKPGIGKTTVVKKVAERFKDRAKGFYTEEIRDRTGRRTGFKAVSLDGREVLLASKEGSSPFKVGSYSVFVEDFERFAVPILKEALEEGTPLIVIDEIGKMELFSDNFEKAVREVFSAEDVNVVATVPLKNFHPVVSWIKRRPDSLLIEVNRENRDGLPDRIVKMLEKSL
ncbi:MAG: NTPase [Aquificae bacterium]|nr:NTPase [Aquificota bacterium]